MPRDSRLECTTPGLLISSEKGSISDLRVLSSRVNVRERMVNGFQNAKVSGFVDTKGTRDSTPA
jgi:hypothetical protein